MVTQAIITVRLLPPKESCSRAMSNFVNCEGANLQLVCVCAVGKLESVERLLQVGVWHCDTSNHHSVTVVTKRILQHTNHMAHVNITLYVYRNFGAGPGLSLMHQYKGDCLW